MFGAFYLSRSETHHVGGFWFFQLESIHLIRPGGSSDARNSGSCRSLLMPSTRRLQSARTETGRYLFVFLKSLVCLFIRLVGSKGSDFPHDISDISVTLWYRNQTYEIYSRWWQLKHFLFSTLFGKDEPILTNIFFRWVGLTTNQYWTNLCIHSWLRTAFIFSCLWGGRFSLLNIFFLGLNYHDKADWNHWKCLSYNI